LSPLWSIGSQLKNLVECADSETISHQMILLEVARRVRPFASSRFYLHHLGDSDFSHHQKCESVKLSFCSLSVDFARFGLFKGVQLLWFPF
jgi:hypothetical protein